MVTEIRNGILVTAEIALGAAYLLATLLTPLRVYVMSLHQNPIVTEDSPDKK